MKQAQYVSILHLITDQVICIPTTKEHANAQILDVFPDGSFTAHWETNYNTNGDFSTELMFFKPGGFLDKDDTAKRNEIRKANYLMEVAY